MQRRFYDNNLTIPKDYILCYDFNGDFLDISPNALHGIAGGATEFAPGAKEGTQSIKFIDGCVRTPSLLPLNSDKVSISFFLKTTQLTTAAIVEMSPNVNINDAFGVFINDIEFPASLNLIDVKSAFNVKGTDAFIPSGWTHFILMIDRSKGKNQNTVIKDGVPQERIIPRFQYDNNGNFVNNILFIGKRNNASIPYSGYLQNLKIYNRPLTSAECEGLRRELQ